ncbi:PAS domain S-box protein [Oleiharenicola lentus]|uniref:histidine kinase n=1 Tax=Oleiharenicola lentus TaxID=2508720 RepID=A0A4Q1C7U7_9BACT|nr:PAS domain S-box protein [Oleiharenicola lentus]RXK54881.1 PAS domain S-box protein [Oleiharenicola lentus]
MNPEPQSRAVTAGLGSKLLGLGASGLRSRAWWIALGYAVFATLWIYFSDQALALLVPDADQRMRWSVYKGSAFVVVTTILLMLFIRQAFGAIESGYALLREQAARRRAGEEHLAAIIGAAMDAIITVDAGGKVVLFNTAAGRLFGCAESAVLGRPLSEILPAGLDGPAGRNLRCEGRRADGSRFPVEATVSAEHGGSRERTIILRDISQREAHEHEIERLRRLYAALSHINQAIVWSGARDALFQKVCDALVRQGGFLLAWTGWHNADTARLDPIGVAGDELGFLREILVSVREDLPEGHGPAGTAFRGGRPCICNDLEADPAVAHLRGAIERYSLRAGASFPIRERNQVVAVLTVYADEPGFFQDKEIALLAESAADLSFALDNLRREEERRHAEQTLRMERLFSDTMIDSMPGVVYFYDTQGRFLRWNRNFERVSGYSGREIAGMHPLDFFSPEERGLLETRIGEVFARGEASVEASFVSKDGTATPYFFTGRRVEFEGQTCLVGVGIDIAEQRRAEAELREMQERFSAVVENMAEGLVIAASDGSLLHWNPAALRILGFADPAVGRLRAQDFPELFELVTPEGQVLAPEQWPLARARRGEQFVNRELRVRRRDTDWERILSYTGAPVRYAGGKALAFVMLTDVTERNKSEQLLRDAKDILQHEVAERTEELRSALVRAEAADRIKSAFLATMSHELRTPLNSIIGFTGIVLQGLAGPLTPEQTKQLGMVRGSARHLLELINDVLDISKIEAGQLEVRFAPVPLPELLERAVASVRPLAERKALALTLEMPPALGEIVSDRRRLEQIMLNLLNNALKFTDRGGVTLRVTLTGDYRPEAGGPAVPAVRLEVADTGIGIRPADLATLFQPFRQIDTGLSRLHDGTGLGLAICRRLATLLGGEINAASEWGRGSQFTVILPLQPPVHP